jgi:spermidine synthase
MSMTRPWKNIDSVDTDEGLLELRQRGEDDFLITISGRVLMNSFAHISEAVLAESACTYIHNRKNPRVRIGGLGLGFTLKAALDKLPADGQVVVAELNPAVVKWCRGPIAGLTDGSVNDARVTVEIGDVASVIQKATDKGGDERYDAIILDLYEGPFEAAIERGDYLYGTAALKRSSSALMPGGVFAVWSEDPDRAFERRMADAGFAFDRKRPGKGGSRHTVYIAKKGGFKDSRSRGVK